MNAFSFGLIAPTLGQAAAPQSPNLFGMLLPMLLIIVVMYFLMIRPQQKRQKTHQAMINSIKSGDRVVIAGGIYGTVAGVDEQKNIMHVKIDENVKIKVERGSVTRVLTEE
jgi:preprotein translocase subunit YajC